jgi:hypothetical protein
MLLKVELSTIKQTNIYRLCLSPFVFVSIIKSTF